MQYLDFEMENYDLHLIKCTKFKTIKVYVDFRMEDERRIAKYASMLRRMLVKTSPKYDSLREINKACANLYSPNYGISNISSGSKFIMALETTFVNEKYTEKGMNEKTIEFVFDFLFNPKIVNGGFEPETFNLEKSVLLEWYKSIKDRPQDYIRERIDEEMPVLNYKDMNVKEIISALESLTEKELYEFYQEMLEKSKLDVFVIGDFDNDEMKRIIDKNIHFKGSLKEVSSHVIKQTSYNENPKVKVEGSSNVQSNLAIGFKALDLTEFERKYVFVLYSWILGGGVNSLLHQSVREENSLCYYIYTSRDILLNVMYVYAGIDGDKLMRVLELVYEQLDKMENGDFPSDLLEGVRKNYLSSLISIEDSQTNLINNYESQKFTGTDSVEVRREMIQKVTKEDIMKFAKKIHMDTVFFLKGEMSVGKEDI